VVVVMEGWKKDNRSGESVFALNMCDLAGCTLNASEPPLHNPACFLLCGRACKAWAGQKGEFSRKVSHVAAMCRTDQSPAYQI